MKGLIIVVEKKYDDDYAIGDVINYMARDVFSSSEDWTSGGCRSADSEEVIEDFYSIQNKVNMQGHLF